MDAVPRRSPDVYLFAATVALIGIGIVMIYSASAIVALDWFGDSAFFLKRQLLWSVLGLGVMSVSLTIHYQRLRRITPALLLLVAVALGAVLIPGIGPPGRGAGWCWVRRVSSRRKRRNSFWSSTWPTI